MKLDPESKAAMPWVMLAYALTVVLERTSTAYRGLASHVCNALRWIVYTASGKPLRLDPPPFTPSLNADAIVFFALVAAFALAGVLHAIESRRQPPIDPPSPAQEPLP